VVDCLSVSNGNSGIYFQGVTLRNCLIAYNYSATLGAGIFIKFAAGVSGLVQNCTIVSNRTSGSSAGIGGNNTGDTGACIVVNTICYSNFSGAFHRNCSYASARETVFTNCNIYTNVTDHLQGNNFLTNMPTFVDFSAGNYRLSRSSPCINAGIQQGWMVGALDLDRHARLDRYSGIVDIGCYEAAPSGTLFDTR